MDRRDRQKYQDIAAKGTWSVVDAPGNTSQLFAFTSGGMHGEASFQGQLVMMGQGAHDAA